MVKVTMSDLGNAQVFADLARPTLRFIPEKREWISWDGRRWSYDETAALAVAKKVSGVWHGEATRLCEQVQDVESGQRESVAQRAERVRRWARSAEEWGRIKNFVGLATQDPSLRVPLSMLDRDDGEWADVLTTPDGVVDAAGALQPPNSGHISTRSTRVAPSGNPPVRWLRFLEEIQPDPTARAFVQRALGYSISGSTSEHLWFLALGEGSNGKSVLLDAVSWVLGDYAWTAPFGLITRSSGAQMHFELAGLQGRRMVLAPETEGREHLNESVVKQVTGSATITCRAIFRDWVTFAPAAKLWGQGQHMPMIRGGDHGVWRRVCVVPFPVRIQEGRRDRNLLPALRSEGGGILSWLIDGMREWKRTGLRIPPAIQDAAQVYRRRIDPAEEFLAQCCVTGAGAGSMMADEIYTAYARWHLHSYKVGEILERSRFFDRLRIQLHVVVVPPTKGVKHHVRGVHLNQRATHLWTNFPAPAEVQAEIPGSAPEPTHDPVIEPTTEPTVLPGELENLELYRVDQRLCSRWESLMGGWIAAYPRGRDWIMGEVRKAHAWEIANPEKRKKNRAAYLANWLNRSQDRPSPSNGSPPGRFDVQAEMERRANLLEENGL